MEATSAILHEKAHSLSYQAKTRTVYLPTTFVCSGAKIQECVVWLKSIETLGSGSYFKTFTMSFSAAFSTIELTSSMVTGILASKVKSTALTFGVGTLRAVPSNFP